MNICFQCHALNLSLNLRPKVHAAGVGCPVAHDENADLPHARGDVPRHGEVQPGEDVALHMLG